MEHEQKVLFDAGIMEAGDVEEAEGDKDYRALLLSRSWTDFFYSGSRAAARDAHSFGAAAPSLCWTRQFN
jgi:hypothetical protein